MNKFITLIGIIFCLISCAVNKDSKAATNSIVFIMTKSPGRGIGPQYKITIYENGEVVIVGKKNFDKIGIYKKNIAVDRVGELVKSFLDANYFEFKKEYTSNVRDFPTVYISFTHSGETKKIVDYFNAPEELKRLEKLIEKIAETKNWTKISD